MTKLIFFIVALFSTSIFYGQFDSSNKKIKIGIVQDKKSNKSADLPINKNPTPPVIEFESSILNKKDDNLYKSISNVPKVGENLEKKQYEVKSVTDLYTEKLQSKLAQEGITREIVNSDVFLGDYNIYTKELNVSARDYSAIDGDMVRIWINGEIVTKTIDLDSNYKTHNYILKEGLNIIQIEALNIGLSFPNTGQFSFVDGNGKKITEQFWGLNQGFRAIIKVYKKQGLE
jgi:hypothetical protein